MLDANLLITPIIIPATAIATNMSALFAINSATPLKKFPIAPTRLVATEVRVEAILV